MPIKADAPAAAPSTLEQALAVIALQARTIAALVAQLAGPADPPHAPITARAPRREG